MNRVEFLAKLRQELSDFTEEEREEALRFYEEYLNEAGPENEAVVIAELGSPEKVARIIRANVPGGARREDGKRRIHLTLDVPDWRAPKAPDPAPREKAPDAAPGQAADPAPETPPAYEYSYDGAPGAPGTPGAAHDRRVLWIILLVATCPLWIGVIGGLFGGACGLIGGLCGVIFGAFATMIAGFASFGLGVGVMVSHSLGNGLLMMGLSLLCVAAGAAVGALSVWAVAKLAPLLFKGIGRLCRAVFGKVRDAG